MKWQIVLKYKKITYYLGGNMKQNIRSNNEEINPATPAL